MSARAILIGHVGHDPETFTFTDGSRNARFPLATNRGWTGRDGERHEATEWHNIEIRSKSLIESVLPHIRKGRLLHVEGDIESSQSETAGVRRKHTKVILRSDRGIITLLGPRPDQADPVTGQTDQAERTEAAAPPADDLQTQPDNASQANPAPAETAVDSPWRDPDRYPAELEPIDIDEPDAAPAADAPSPAASEPGVPAEASASPAGPSGTAEPVPPSEPAEPKPADPEPAPAAQPVPLPQAEPRQSILAAGQGVS